LAIAAASSRAEGLAQAVYVSPLPPRLDHPHLPGQHAVWNVMDPTREVPAPGVEGDDSRGMT
jgi:hypothetical protein